MMRSTSDWSSNDEERDRGCPDVEQDLDGAFGNASDDGDADSTNFASSFAPGGSQRLSLQEAKDGGPDFQVQSATADAAGRSLRLAHPIILRDLPPQADARASQAQLNQLHRSLTQRDLVLPQFLRDYRYLNTLQLKELFFPSLRSCQIRLHHLKSLGLLYAWKVIDTPGVRRRHSLCLISPRGARVVADWHGDDPRDYLERSRDARDHCWHSIHDLEANQFFLSLAIRSRQLAGEGLLLWSGEAQVREERRRLARQYKWPVPTPDGCGVYIAAGGRILFDLEWDRATESMDRMRQKVASYVGYFEHIANAELHHVMFVVPNDDREDRLRYEIWRGRPEFGSDRCCTFWTTTNDRLHLWGPLGAIWLELKNREPKPPSEGVTRLGRRIPFRQLPPVQPNERSTAACIGKPSWWLRRPGGGQVA